MKDIGHAVGGLEEFREWAKIQFNDIRQDNKQILKKIDDINHDRWVLYGKLTIVNGMIMFLVEAIAHKLIAF